MWPSWHLVRQHLIVMAGFWPWSDSMTGTSIARLQRHYLVLTVQSCPGLITCFVLEACTWHELTYSFSQFFLEACTYMGLTCSFFFCGWKHTFEDLAFDLAPCNQVDVWPGSTRQRTCLPRPLHYIILCVCHRRNDVAFFSACGNVF